MVDESFARYLNGPFDQIEGWPGNLASVEFLAVVEELLSSQAVQGGACEIGVHHGKYLIALHNLRGGAYRSLGMDLFEDQSRNIDGSGRGDFNVCLENIHSHAKNPENCSLHSVDSLTLREGELSAIRGQFGEFALFSVDGGHTPMHVASDFSVASKLTSSKGVIIIDDVFHPDWPGVTEGLYRFFASLSTPFVPWFITRKKLFCCHASLRAIYGAFLDEKLSSEFAHLGTTRISFFGHPAVSIAIGSHL